MGTLTDLDVEPLIERYAEDGVILIEELLDHDELEEVRAHIRRYNTHIVPTLPPEIQEKTVRFEPDGTSIRSCYYMDQIDGFFREFGNRPQFKDLVGRIVGWEPELYVVETFNKYARVGTAAVPHQDTAYFEIEPLDMAHLWIAIDDATEENGALRYWLGSHSEGLLPHHPAVKGYLAVDLDIVEPISHGMLTGVLPAGGAAIHSGLVVHDSPDNYSDKPRLGILCGYRGAHTKFLGLGMAQ